MYKTVLDDTLNLTQLAQSYNKLKSIVIVVFKLLANMTHVYTAIFKVGNIRRFLCYKETTDVGVVCAFRGRSFGNQNIIRKLSWCMSCHRSAFLYLFNTSRIYNASWVRKKLFHTAMPPST